MTVAPERKQVTQFFHLIEQPIEGICSAGPRLVSVCCVRPSNACGCSHGLAQNVGRALALKIESAHMPFKPDLCNKMGQKETSRLFPRIGT
jgi:hypothetical protein